MNVSILTDTQLNRAMIWLYSKSRFIHKDYSIGDVVGNLIWTREVNYLADWNLTMPLAHIKGLELFLTDGVIGSRASYGAGFLGNYISTRNKNPLRAICEVLVMIKMESK